MTTRTPSSLLARLRQPFEPEAWARFVALYTPLIYSWARHLGLQEQDAADLVQDVFVTLLQVLPTFNYDRQQSFRKWLRTVAINRWKKERKRQRPRLVQGAEGQPEPVAVGDALEACWEAEYRQHLVRQALQLMRTDFEETTWKACWETAAAGRPAADVAAELSLTVGAVHAAKFRVLSRLRHELQGLLD
jgi:RNA polymerase sigma-70 factor (ECF subfamily)